jgi:hypothetical protein
MKVARPGTRQAVPHHIPPKLLAPCPDSLSYLSKLPLHLGRIGAPVHQCIIHVQSLNQVNTQHQHHNTLLRRRTFGRGHAPPTRELAASSQISNCRTRPGRIGNWIGNRELAGSRPERSTSTSKTTYLLHWSRTTTRYTSSWTTIPPVVWTTASPSC